MDWAAHAMELLWIGALTAIPLALVVALSCRWPGCRPATRHALWVAVLVSFVTPAVASVVWRPGWFQSERVLAAAEAGIGRLRSELSLRPVAPTVHGTVAAIPSQVPPHTRGPDASVKRETRPVRALPLGVETARPFVSPSIPRGSVELSEPAAPSRAAGWAPSPALAAVDNGRPLEADLSEVTPAPTRPPPAPRVVELPTRSEPVRAHPGAPAEVVKEEEAAGSVGTPWEDEFRDWVAHVVMVRDSVAAMPPMPLSIWAGGAAVVVAIGVARAAGFRRVMRRARPASAETVELVRAAAVELGMRRAPTTLLTGERVSPMVWCGIKPRLVLPVGLWRELDARSRQGVLLHELAHLKRRDHWLCWLGAVVGVVYWWHPVAWWARKRMRDEADASCDAWVTSLMPEGRARRAYAEALVTTRWYLSVPGRRAPCGVGGAGALGVMSGRTKHLARRLKMVMTQRVAPRSSVTGALAALGVLAIGMFVMPGLACPPEEQAKAEKAADQRARAIHAELALRAARAPSAPKAPKAPKAAQAEADVAEFFGEAPALEAIRRGEQGATRPDEDQMLRRLEERMRRLEEQIRRLERSGGSGQAGRASMLDFYSAADGADVVREYRLPEGKREALVELMAREDVPVIIERRDKGIAVHGPESDQRVFAAFVRLIHPEGQATMPDAALDELRAAARRDVLTQRENQRTHMEQLHRQMQQMERERHNAEHAAERARERSDTVEQEAETIEERLEQLRESEDDDGADASTLQAEVRRLAATLEAKTRRVAELVAEAAQREDVAATIEAAIEKLQEQIEALAESLEEEIEELIEPPSHESGLPAPLPAPTPRASTPAPLSVGMGRAPLPPASPTPATPAAAPSPPVPPAPPAPAAGAAAPIPFAPAIAPVTPAPARPAASTPVLRRGWYM